MWTRYSDLKSDQFTQKDPIGIAGGMNLYGFAGADPINFTDPFGLCPPEGDNRRSECADGGVAILSLAGNAAIATFGVNAQAGVAMNVRTGALMLFLQGGPSFGGGASIGVNMGGQTGSLNDVLRSTAKGGGASVSAALGGVGGAVSVAGSERGLDGRLSGAAAGRLGAGAGGFLNFSWGGIGTPTVNVYEAVRAAAGAAASTITRAAEANARASQCAHRCPKY